MRKLLGRVLVVLSAAVDVVGEKLVVASCALANLGYRLQGRTHAPADFAAGALRQVFDEAAREAMTREVLARNPMIRTAPVGQRVGRA